VLRAKSGRSLTSTNDASAQSQYDGPTVTKLPTEHHFTVGRDGTVYD